MVRQKNTLIWWVSVECQIRGMILDGAAAAAAQATSYCYPGLAAAEAVAVSETSPSSERDGGKLHTVLCT